MIKKRKKTKIVATLGPAVSSKEMMKEMMIAGVNVFRINFSHAEYEDVKTKIRWIRELNQESNYNVAALADLQGPKLRVGVMEEGVELNVGDTFVFTTEKCTGTSEKAFMTYQNFPKDVEKGEHILVDDGKLLFEVIDSDRDTKVTVKVLRGGPLKSKKGVNLPNTKISLPALTKKDIKDAKFAIEQEVDWIALSFVRTPEDLVKLSDLIKEKSSYKIPIIAKIEKPEAVANINHLTAYCDGIMVARGDLGVEIPIEQIAVVQKFVIARANLVGKPVITATQMLESMTHNRRPTRAEATDVANAILDGTDCVMLSEESAMGAYPLESVSMLAKICAATEPHRLQEHRKGVLIPQIKQYLPSFADNIAGSIEKFLKSVEDPVAVFIPTSSGQTARSVTRARLPVWILSASPSAKTCQELMFSYGVWPVENEELPADWMEFLTEQIDSLHLNGKSILAVEGPSMENPGRNHRIELIHL